MPGSLFPFSATPLGLINAITSSWNPKLLYAPFLLPTGWSAKNDMNQILSVSPDSCCCRRFLNDTLVAAQRKWNNPKYFKIIIKFTTPFAF